VLSIIFFIAWFFIRMIQGDDPVAETKEHDREFATYDGLTSIEGIDPKI
jgi:hypothetical protein